MVGEWLIEEQLPVAIPGFAEQGDTLKMAVATTWGSKKSFLKTHIESFVNGKMLKSDTRILGWDRENKQILEYGFDTLGGRTKIVTTPDDEKTFVAKAQEVRPDGAVQISTLRMAFVDQDTIEFQIEAMMVNGMKEPVPPGTIIAKRTK